MHTPGPWHANDNLRSGGASPGVDIGAANGANIALVHFDVLDPSVEETYRETRANARLIALAPEMAAMIGKLLRALNPQAAADVALRDFIVADARALLARLAGREEATP